MRSCLILSLILLIHSSLVLADDKSQQQLKQVKSEIQTLSQDVSTNKASQAELFSQLKLQSQAVSNLNKNLLDLKQKISQQNVELIQLEQQLSKQSSSHKKQLSALNQQVRAAYIHGQPGFLKILLNQQDPAMLSRSASYYHYFHQARQQQLVNITDTLANLSEQQKALFSAQRSQQKLYDQQQEKQAFLNKKTKQRQATLSLLEGKITDQDSRLTFLHQQEKSLHSLLQSLNKPVKNKVINTQSKQTSFATRAGDLSWPVKGKILARYGSSRNVGKLRWQGILIAAPTGHDILASAPGQIVFADWLRGFGLLVIIDHGDQYMSLYGNNETLLKQVGDTVMTGELIALSGDKGVRQHAGLYFEIRYKGSPTNPLKWLSKKG